MRRKKMVDYTPREEDQIIGGWKEEMREKGL